MKLHFFISLFIINFAYSQEIWTPIGPDGGWADRVVYHPTNPAKVYAGGDTYGSFYSSIDNADTWQRNVDFGNLNVWDISFNPHNTDHIYVGNIMNDSIGIIRSLDGGINWDTILKWPDIASIVFHPTSADTIFAGAGLFPDYQEQLHGEGVWRSIDGGTSWSHVGLDSLSVQSVAINPDFPNVIYAGTYDLFGTQTTGVYSSIDGGDSWFLAGLADKEVWKVEISPSESNIVFAATWDSLYKSSNYGTTWIAMNAPASFYMDIEISPVDNHIIYAASLFDGIFKSIDNGDNWEAMNSGLSTIRAWDIELHPLDVNTVIHTQMGYGIWKSTDGAASWTTAHNGFRCHYGLELDIDNEGDIWTGFYNEQGNHFASVKKWDGTSWQESGLNEHWISEITVDPSNDEIIYVASQHEDQNEEIGGDLYKSINAGDSWEMIDIGLPDSIKVYSLLVDHTVSNTLYAGTGWAHLVYTGGKGVYKSTDGGGTWSSSGLDGQQINKLVMHPTDNSILYAATLSDVYKSIDYGITWNPTGLGGAAALSLEIDDRNPNILYVGTYLLGVYKTINAGETWSNIGMVENSITDIAVYKDHIYVAGSESILPGLGVWHSDNGGDSWTNYSEGLINFEISRIVLDKIEGTIYAATLGYGIYKRRAFSSTATISTAIPTDNNFLVFPNPTNTNQINLLIKKKGVYTIEIFNNIGEIQQKKTIYLSRGSVIFPLSNLSKGIYYIQLFMQGDLVGSEKLIVQ